jgi:hypothetical protein
MVSALTVCVVFYANTTHPDVDAKIDAVGKLQPLLDLEDFEVDISPFSSALR